MFSPGRILFAAVASLLALPPSAGQEAAWTIVLHPKDFVIGAALRGLHTRHAWVDGFDDRTGNFEVAVFRKAAAIPAPRCRMDYLILKIPFYYPENPKQASVDERRSIYNSLVALQKADGGSVSIRAEAPSDLARRGAREMELVSCMLYFALPLSMQSSTR
jgi:hypothetical protein